MSKADAAIVGGGPAGVAVALLLAREGYEVALFDRATFPRDKPCGEFLNPAACDLLDSDLGVGRGELEAAGAADVGAIRLDFGGAEPLEVPLLDAQGTATYGLTMRRTSLDAWLLDRAREAGVRVHEGHNVRRVLMEGDQAVGVAGDDFECRAKLVLACDGTHSVVARELRLVRPVPWLQQVAAVAHFEGVMPADEGARAVWMYAAQRGGNRGVAGFCEQGDGGAILSCVLPKKRASLVAGEAERFIDEQTRHFPGLQARLSGARLCHPVRTVPCFGHRVSRAFAPGVLLAGDAACFVDPFTGEGIHHALLGGILAARTASRALATGDVSARALTPYARERRELAQRYALCGVVQTAVTWPWLIGRLGRNLRRRPEAARRLIGALVDVLPPQAVLHPRFLLNALLP